MKLKHLTVAISILWIGNQTVSGQNFSVSLNNGIALTNLHSNTDNMRWYGMPGTVTSLSAAYQLNDYWSIGSGVDLMATSYKFAQMYNYYFPGIDYYYPQSSFVPVPYPPQTTYHYQTFRFPVAFILQSHSNPVVYLRAGFYYANNRVAAGGNIYGDSKSTHDIGFVLARGLKYAINPQFSLKGEIALTRGLRDSMNIYGKHGALEVSMGVHFTPGGKADDDGFEQKNGSNSRLLTSTGYTQSRISKNATDAYQPAAGFLLGMELQHSIKGKNPILQTGLIYNRKAYALQDSSTLLYYHQPGKNNLWADTRTDIDYLQLPFRLHGQLGQTIKLNAGVGFYVAMLLNAKTVGEAYRTNFTEDGYIETFYEVYNTADFMFRDFDWGYQIQVGVSATVWRLMALGLKINYEKSLMNAIRDADSGKSLQIETLYLQGFISFPIQ